MENQINTPKEVRMLSQDAIELMTLLPSELPDKLQEKAFEVFGRTKIELASNELLEALIEAKELIDNLTKDKSPLLGKPTKNKINIAINKAMGK